jgi:hypothetical protein
MVAEHSVKYIRRNQSSIFTERAIRKSFTPGLLASTLAEPNDLGFAKELIISSMF